jgi:hypothetical protein
MMSPLRRIPWTGRLAFIGVPTEDGRTLVLDTDTEVRTLPGPLPVYAIIAKEVIPCGFIESIRVETAPGVGDVSERQELWGNGFLFLDRRTAMLADRLAAPHGIPCGVDVVTGMTWTESKTGSLLVKDWTLRGLALYVDDGRAPAWEWTYITVRDPD